MKLRLVDRSIGRLLLLLLLLLLLDGYVYHLVQKKLVNCGGIIISKFFFFCIFTPYLIPCLFFFVQNLFCSSKLSRQFWGEFGFKKFMINKAQLLLLFVFLSCSCILSFFLLSFLFSLCFSSFFFPKIYTN